MIRIPQFCPIKKINNKHMNKKVSSELSKMTAKFGLILGGIVSFILLFVNYSGILNLDLETVMAPVLVITCLAYGDKILIISIVFLSKYFPKFNQMFTEYAENHNQKYSTEKRSA